MKRRSSDDSDSEGEGTKRKRVRLIFQPCFDFRVHFSIERSLYASQKNILKALKTYF